jgi:hypothetical protein
MAALTPQDKERVRYHLGFLNTEFAGSIQFGLPRPVQTLFIVEDAMNLVVDEFAIDRVRRMLKILDDIECRLVASQDRLAASALGELKIERQGPQEPDLLEREYYRWGGRLADHLGVPTYAYSNRYKNGQPGGGVRNVPVK